MECFPNDYEGIGSSVITLSDGPHFNYGRQDMFGIRIAKRDFTRSAKGRIKIAQLGRRDDIHLEKTMEKAYSPRRRNVGWCRKYWKEWSWIQTQKLE
jgi:hypothetical protein